MTDRILTIDDVPEADRAEQSVPAYRTDDAPEPEFPTAAADREADEADIIEQTLEVPLDDDYAENSEDADTDY
ncbi:hypothetical protein [Nocardia macrotermitis]|uniref:Uncharacterized protein n=1 Tax=Nocardia macrotermitis TaxID=2585198 RepID=A0A7K0CXX5_9NOCA|nr:hypothetical protein [Nocardia macrotermitis]MQY18283.1 hypothetical protein [Nocardia macrotermitis]